MTAHQDTTGSERKVFSLFELTKSIESVIGKAYQRSYWIRAEIAKLNYYPKSGHCYPDLVEKENGHTRAQIRATIWAGPFQSISRKFMEVTREPLSDGMKVLFLASVNFHPTHGLTLQISDIDPSFSLGEMARERNASIAKLKKEGLFDRNRTIPFPMLPQRVAIISVETSKGYHDFMQTIVNNENGFQLFTMLFPALLQGAGAITSIKQQLARIKKVKSHFDVVIIIRGGGGDVGLSSFDHYALASAVASFPVPIITGIGHATNQTVVELVAHSNKITPTEVAYFLLERCQLSAERVYEAETFIMGFAADLLIQHNQRLSFLADRMNTRTQSLMAGHHYRLSRSGLLLERELKSRSHHQRLQLKQLKDRLKGAVSQLFVHDKVALQSFGQQFEKELPRFLSFAIRQVDLLEQKTQLLDPVNVLKRGFSITTLQGKSVSDAVGMNVGDEIETHFYNGKTVSVIKKIES